MRDGRQTGLCGALSPDVRDAAQQVQRDAAPRVPRGASGCSAAGSPATPSMIWVLIIAWLLMARHRRNNETLGKSWHSCARDRWRYRT